MGIMATKCCGIGIERGQYLSDRFFLLQDREGVVAVPLSKLVRIYLLCPPVTQYQPIEHTALEDNLF